MVFLFGQKKKLGDDLFSQNKSKYLRRWSVSLPSSERDRVVPLRSCHQAQNYNTKISHWQYLYTPLSSIINYAEKNCFTRNRNIKPGCIVRLHLLVLFSTNTNQSCALQSAGFSSNDSYYTGAYSFLNEPSHPAKWLCANRFRG